MPDLLSIRFLWPALLWGLLVLPLLVWVYARRRSFSHGMAASRWVVLSGHLPFGLMLLGMAALVLAMALCTLKARMWKAAIFACIGGPLGDPALWAGIPAALRQAAGLATTLAQG